MCMLQPEVVPRRGRQACRQGTRPLTGLQILVGRGYLRCTVAQAKREKSDDQPSPPRKTRVAGSSCEEYTIRMSIEDKSMYRTYT